MANAMEQKRVYELFGVRADFYRPAMEKRGYFQREKANLKLAKIKVLGRSKVDTNVIACESRNKVIREFRNDFYQFRPIMTSSDPKTQYDPHWPEIWLIYRPENKY